MAEEYESLETGVGLTWKHANLEVNRPKNRYANVVAYDHSRVLLSQIDDVIGSDYINANYIDGYKRSKAYIATQVSPDVFVCPNPTLFGNMFVAVIWR